eukprot:scaffold16350_cov101-Isochrysis_galbana.AAC.3
MEALQPVLDALAPAIAYLPTHPASIVTVRPSRAPRRHAWMPAGTARRFAAREPGLSWPSADNSTAGFVAARGGHGGGRRSAGSARLSSGQHRGVPGTVLQAWCLNQEAGRETRGHNGYGHRARACRPLAALFWVPLPKAAPARRLCAQPPMHSHQLIDYT